MSDILADLQQYADHYGYPEELPNFGPVARRAVSEITRLRPYVDAFRREETRADKLGQEIDDLRAQLEAARKALGHYAEQYCEGWCKDAPSNATFDDCDGCKARAGSAALEGSRS